MELKKAYRMVIDDLDEEMVDTPSRQLADASNFLEARYQDMDDEE